MQSSKTLMRYDCSKSGRLMEIFRPTELDNNEKQQLFEASEAETKMKNDQLVCTLICLPLPHSPRNCGLHEPPQRQFYSAEKTVNEKQQTESNQSSTRFKVIGCSTKYNGRH